MTDDTIHTCSYYCERPECVRRQRDELRDRLEAVLAQQPPSAPVGVDFVMVPKEPSEGVLVSMAIRYDHGLGVPGYYDQPLFGGENGGHKRRMESTVAKMRQLYEEVVGAGFYSREREEEYAALAQQPAAPQQPAGRVHDLAARLVDELDGLVGESDGVSGLHLNGDVATWDELLPGGRFERLSSLDELRAALAAKQGGAE